MDWFLYPSCCVCRHTSFPLFLSYSYSWLFFSQVCQEPFFDAGLIWTKPTSQTSQPHQKHQFYDDNKFLKMWSSLCWWFDLPNAVTSVPPVPMQNAKCLILASNPLNLPFLWTVVVVFSRSCWRPAPWFLDPDIAFWEPEGVQFYVKWSASVKVYK